MDAGKATGKLAIYCSIFSQCLVNISDHVIETKSIKYKTDVHKNNFVCCTPTYRLLTPLPKAFMALLENKTFFALFSSENLDFPITEQGKKKNMKNKIFPTYLPNQKIQGRDTANKQFFKDGLKVKGHKFYIFMQPKGLETKKDS